jgi:hypothetical protein
MTRARSVLAFFVLALMAVPSLAQKSLGQSDNPYFNKMVGRWLIQQSQAAQNIKIEIITVQDYIANGAMNQESQYLVTTGSTVVSCVARSAYDWSMQGNLQFQTLRIRKLTPDYLKENNVKIDDPSRLKAVCDSVAGVTDQSNYVGKTSQFRIISLDESQNTYEYTDSDGKVVRSTDKRVKEGFSFYKRK